MAHIPWEYKEELYKVAEYTPLRKQALFHHSKAKHRVVAGGNRGGKTECLAMEILPYLMWPNTAGWVVTKIYDLSEPLKEKLINVLVYKLGHKQVDSAGMLAIGEFNWNERFHILTMWTGSTLTFKSAENPDSLHAKRLDYVIIDEGSLFPGILYDTRLVPRLVDTGGWIASGGTFEYLQGDWFVDYFEVGQSYPNQYDVQSWSLPTTENPHIDREWLKQEERRLCRTEEGKRIYQARYLAIPVVSAYLVFPDFNRIKHVSEEYCEFDENLPVYIAIDPGGVYAVAAVQFKPIEGRGNDITSYTCCIIDEIYTTNTDTIEVIQDCKRRPWWNKVVGGAIDVAATEQFRMWSVKAGVPLARKKVPIQAGIQTLNHWISCDTLLSSPNCVMFETEMARYSYPTPGIAHMDTYDPRTRNPVDAWNHLTKAVIYLLVTKFGYYKVTKSKRDRKPMWGRGG